MGEPLLNRNDRLFIENQVNKLTEAIQELTHVIEEEKE